MWFSSKDDKNPGMLVHYFVRKIVEDACPFKPDPGGSDEFLEGCWQDVGHVEHFPSSPSESSVRALLPASASSHEERGATSTDCTRRNLEPWNTLDPVESCNVDVVNLTQGVCGFMWFRDLPGKRLI